MFNKYAHQDEVELGMMSLTLLYINSVGFCSWHDVAVKRGKFIGKVNSLLQELHFVQPEVFMKLLNVYFSSFYGNNLWNLNPDEVDRIFKS